MSNKTRWSWEQGNKVVGEWRRSGLSMAAFARKREIGTQRLRYWRDRIESEDAGNGRTTEAKLVPGVVVGLGSAGLSVLDPAWVAALVVALERS
jgi:transposase-like protein